MKQASPKIEKPQVIHEKVILLSLIIDRFLSGKLKRNSLSPY